LQIFGYLELSDKALPTYLAYSVMFVLLSTT